MKSFELFYEIDGKKIQLGKMSFNGRFIFELDETVNIEAWKRHGIIPVNPKTRKIENEDLFEYINSRLPIHLRESAKEEKIEYIKKTGLRTPSDQFYFQSI